MGAGDDAALCGLPEHFGKAGQAKCWLTSFHPARCRWCALPRTRETRRRMAATDRAGDRRQADRPSGPVAHGGAGGALDPHSGRALVADRNEPEPEARPVVAAGAGGSFRTGAPVSPVHGEFANPRKTDRAAGKTGGYPIPAPPRRVSSATFSEVYCYHRECYHREIVLPSRDGVCGREASD
jgi:hypothetical protein